MFIQRDNYGFRGARKFRLKAQAAENGAPFSRTAMQYWSTWAPPLRPSREAAVRSIAPGRLLLVRLLEWTRPLPARRASWPTTSQLAEAAVTILKEH